MILKYTIYESGRMLIAIDCYDSDTKEVNEINEILLWIDENIERHKPIKSSYDINYLLSPEDSFAFRLRWL